MAPKRATTTGRGRWYDWRGERYWSATTIIGGGLPKPALIPWGMKAVAEGGVKEAEVLQVMLRQCQTPDECKLGNFCDPCHSTVSWLKGLPYSKRDKAAELGTYVHDAVEAHILDKPMPTWPPAVRARLKSFEQFLADYEPTYLEGMTEASVYSRQYRYAGTLDAILEVDGRRLLVDYKTGGKAIYEDVALQLAAYRYAEFIAAPDGSEVPMPEVDGCAALHLPEAGYEFVDVQAGPEEFAFFLHVKEVFRFQEEARKAVLRGPLRRGVDQGVQDLGQMLLTSEEKG